METVLRKVDVIEFLNGNHPIGMYHVYVTNGHGKATTWYYGNKKNFTRKDITHVLIEQ